jgi:hypothetical protein
MEEELEAIERGVQRREPASKKCGTKIMFYQLLGASTPLSTPLKNGFTIKKHSTMVSKTKDNLSCVVLICWKRG